MDTFFKHLKASYNLVADGVTPSTIKEWQEKAEKYDHLLAMAGTDVSNLYVSLMYYMKDRKKFDAWCEYTNSAFGGPKTTYEDKD